MENNQSDEYQYNGFITDGHLDIAYNGVVLKRELKSPVVDIRRAEMNKPPLDRTAGTCMVSFPELMTGKVSIIGGSIFVEPAIKSRPSHLPVYRTPEEAFQLAVQQTDYYLKMEDENDQIRLLRSSSDVDAVHKEWEEGNEALGIFIIMEGAEAIQEPDSIEFWLEQGVRGVGLTWSMGTRYSGGNAAPGPLTDEGIALLNVMADYQMLLDISHMWIDAAHQALDRYPGIVVATHANPRQFSDSPRQLPDDIIRRLAERNGVVGIVAFSPMLKTAWHPTDPPLPLTRMVNAIDYVCQLTGQVNNVAIGSDLDGGFGREHAPAGLDTIADLSKIGAELKEKGYSKSDIEAILTGNWLRIMREVLDNMG
jgi:membrane dipeptidase